MFFCVIVINKPPQFCLLFEKKNTLSSKKDYTFKTLFSQSGTRVTTRRKNTKYCVVKFDTQ